MLKFVAKSLAVLSCGLMFADAFAGDPTFRVQLDGPILGIKNVKPSGADSEMETGFYSLGSYETPEIGVFYDNTLFYLTPGLRKVRGGILLRPDLEGGLEVQIERRVFGDYKRQKFTIAPYATYYYKKNDRKFEFMGKIAISNYSNDNGTPNSATDGSSSEIMVAANYIMTISKNLDVVPGAEFSIYNGKNSDYYAGVDTNAVGVVFYLPRIRINF